VDLALYMGKLRRVSTLMAVKMDVTKSDCSKLAMDRRSGFYTILEAQQANHNAWQEPNLMVKKFLLPNIQTLLSQ
jgi:hypothetical protein